MTVSSIGNIEKSVHQTNAWVKDVQALLGCTENEAFLALRSTLQNLRDRLTIEEATDFAAQLPIVLKGAFYEQWNPVGKPEKMDRTAFVSRVHAQFSNDPNMNPEDVVMAVFKVLKNRIGKMRHILSNMPPDIEGIIRESGGVTDEV